MTDDDFKVPVPADEMKELAAKRIAELERTIADLRAELAEANLQLSQCQVNCEHEWEKVDASFDHAFGCEVIRYMQCENCGKRAEWDDVPHPEDDDEPRIDQRELREIDP